MDTGDEISPLQKFYQADIPYKSQQKGVASQLSSVLWIRANYE